MGRTLTVVREAIAAGRGRFRFIFGLAALIFIPLGFVDALDTVSGGINTEGSGEFGQRGVGTSIAVFLLHLITATLGQLLLAGAVAVAVAGTPPGEKPSLRHIVSVTRWPTLVLVDVLFVVGLLLSALLFIVPLSLLSIQRVVDVDVLVVACVVAAALLLWIPIRFYARYALVSVLAELEELDLRQSFRRSAELTDGSKRLVLGVLLSASLIGHLVTWLIQSESGHIIAGEFISDWVAASASQIILNPAFSLLAVALALMLGTKPTLGAAGEEAAP